MIRKLTDFYIQVILNISENKVGFSKISNNSEQIKAEFS